MVDVVLKLLIWLKNKHVEIFYRSLKLVMYKRIPTKIQKCNSLFFSTFSINILLNSLYLIFASDGNPKLITVKIMWKYDLIKILKYLFLGVNLAFLL